MFNWTNLPTDFLRKTLAEKFIRAGASFFSQCLSGSSAEVCRVPIYIGMAIESIMLQQYSNRSLNCNLAILSSQSILKILYDKKKELQKTKQNKESELLMCYWVMEQNIIGYNYIAAACFLRNKRRRINLFILLSNVIRTKSI